MPNTPSRLTRGNVSNPSDSVLGFISAAAFGVISYKMGAPGSTFFAKFPLPNDWMSIVSEVYLLSYLFLISRNSIANLLIILKINSPNFRSNFVSAISVAKTENLTVELLMDKISPFLRHMRKDYIRGASEEMRAIEVQPIDATSFSSSMKRFKVTFLIKDGKVVDYEKEGLS